MSKIKQVGRLYVDLADRTFRITNALSIRPTAKNLRSTWCRSISLRNAVVYNDNCPRWRHNCNGRL